MSELKIEDIKDIQLVGYQLDLENKIFNAINFLFSNTLGYIPFKGFLLYGPPGNGKTEIIKQASKKIAEAHNAKIMFIDGSDIASPKWGDAEKTLKNIFEINDKEKRILIFDDIESLLIARSSELAKEWHYSINSVLFHSLDMLDPSKMIVLATTNRIDLVDQALLSRLYTIEVPLPKPEEISIIIKNYIELWNLPSDMFNLIWNEVKANLTKNNLDIRRALQIASEKYFDYLMSMR
ncbi:MAG: AAA family ATPase [Minisyncoccia bacterium]|jgi:SpoVK/Ycf46/Vps4 family AAA+-type ATPase